MISVIEQAIVECGEDQKVMLNDIMTHCSQAITSGIPMYKQLPSSLESISRIKLRHRKSTDPFHTDLNNAFDIDRLYQRSLICTSTTSGDTIADHSWYAIYPVDDFKYRYNPVVSDINTLRDIDPKLLPLVVDVSFSSQILHSICDTPVELLIFDIPAYYAIRLKS